jgi:secreted trypsin-like serine protease
MAKVILNPLITAVYSRLDNHVFRRTATGGTSVIKLADMSNVQWSEAQQAQRQRFKEAVAYASSALADPQVCARYEERAAASNQRPRELEVSDFFKGRNLLTKPGG